MRDRNSERGFTLIELMAVVVILAILAVVVLPNFMKESTKSKQRMEASTMFAEIAVKQEQFKAEKNRYLGDIDNPPDYDGSTTCPGSVPVADYSFMTTCVVPGTGTAWEALRIDPAESKSRCQYTITTGLAGTTFTPPTGFKNSQGALNAAEATLASSWWTVYAECDSTGQGGTNAKFFQSSVDRSIQALNEGS